MKAIVGYTGFVGSNLTASGDFDAKYNSGNIREAFGTKPDLLVYSGLRAEKYLANNDPEKDLLMIKDAENNISEIAPKKLVLISTIDVFKSPLGVDENSTIDVSGLAAYGYHRYLLECRVRENYPDALIIRLPGLFGRNIKKNFIYDFINVIPFMLNEKKFLELSGKQPELLKYYDKQANGFYKVNVTGPEKEGLKDMFRALGFSALNFTDSRSRFQFYDLKDLWADMNIALNSGITLWHPATEPVSAGEPAAEDGFPGEFRVIGQQRRLHLSHGSERKIGVPQTPALAHRKVRMAVADQKQPAHQKKPSKKTSNCAAAKSRSAAE